MSQYMGPVGKQCNCLSLKNMVTTGNTDYMGQKYWKHNFTSNMK